MDITTAAPAEIDAVIADLQDKAYVIATRKIREIDNVLSCADMRLASDKVRGGYDDRVVGTIEDAIAKIESGEGFHSWNLPSARARVERLQAAREEYAANKALQAPLHAEFTRRGGWTRAFLVITSGKGHLHSSMDCNTCYPTTRFGWLPQVSGHAEAEIVAGAGSDACTICYPSAPVETAGVRTLLHKTEVEAQVARDEKAAAKVARDAAKAAKALVLRLGQFGVDGYAGRIDTVTGAKAYLTDSFMWNSTGREHPSYPAAAVAFVAEALAVKNGTTAEVEMAAAHKRYAKRR